jgi:hypothetical protein
MQNAGQVQPATQMHRPQVAECRNPTYYQADSANSNINSSTTKGAVEKQQGYHHGSNCCNR